MAELIDVRDDGRDAGVERAAEVLRDGQLAVVPTDTVYGLAADAFDLDGTARLAAAKDRDRRTPVAVLVRSPKQLAGISAAIPEAAERLMAAFWPGALTLVLPVAEGLRWDVGRTEGTVAVRMPLDEVALAVVRLVGPLAVSGAGRTGAPAATTVTEAYEAFGDEVAVYLDGGPRRGRATSTVVDVTRERPAVLRAGALPDEVVLAVAVGELDPLEAATRLQEGDRPPGEEVDGQPGQEDRPRG